MRRCRQGTVSNLFSVERVGRILGVAFWPVHFAGMIDWYPGEAPARMMVCGLFRRKYLVEVPTLINKEVSLAV
jgi:hypothetical protein